MIQEKTVRFPNLENCSLSRFYNRPTEGLEAKVCVCLRFMGSLRGTIGSFLGLRGALMYTWAQRACS